MNGLKLRGRSKFLKIKTILKGVVFLVIVILGQLKSLFDYGIIKLTLIS